MGNKTNHRRGGKTPRNSRQQELPIAHGCGGEGHNGQTGRSKWKKLSRRCERRALKEGRVPRIKKRLARFIPPNPIETEY